MKQNNKQGGNWLINDIRKAAMWPDCNTSFTIARLKATLKRERERKAV